VEGSAYPAAATSRAVVADQHFDDSFLDFLAFLSFLPFLPFLPFLHSYGVYQIGDV